VHFIEFLGYYFFWIPAFACLCGFARRQAGMTEEICGNDRIFFTPTLILPPQGGGKLGAGLMNRTTTF